MIHEHCKRCQQDNAYGSTKLERMKWTVDFVLQLHPGDQQADDALPRLTNLKVHSVTS